MFSDSGLVVTLTAPLGSSSCKFTSERSDRLVRGSAVRLHELFLAMFTFYFTASVKENSDDRMGADVWEWREPQDGKTTDYCDWRRRIHRGTEESRHGAL